MQEMFTVMTCWKSTGFDDNCCRKELESFVSCVQKMRSGQEVINKRSGESKIWPPEEVNSKFREFIKNK